MIATLLALGILKHWFLVLPLPDSALWESALGPETPRSHRARRRKTRFHETQESDLAARPSSTNVEDRYSEGRIQVKIPPATSPPFLLTLTCINAPTGSVG